MATPPVPMIGAVVVLVCVACSDAVPGTGSPDSGAAADTGSDAGTTPDSPVCQPAIPGGACDTIPQCGCADGQSCIVVTVDGVTACVASGSVPPYHECTPGTCTAGYQCVADVCKQFCETPNDCATGGDCVAMKDAASGQLIPGQGVCTANCQLQDPSKICGPGVNCAVYEAGFTECVKAGTGTDVGSCPSQDAKECAAGYGCFGLGNCRKWCRTLYDDCAAGQVCEATDPPTIIGSEPYGYCI